MTHSNIVTIVGSRKAPDDVCKFTAEQSLYLRSKGVLVRTGDATRGVDDSVCFPLKYTRDVSADEVVLSKTVENLEIYVAQDAVDDDKAEAMATKYHKAWDHLTDFAKLLHARNCYQVAGLLLNNPSTCVLCWTPDGANTHAKRIKATGGTGTAISVASMVYNIPVFNVRNGKDIRAYYAFIHNLIGA